MNQSSHTARRLREGFSRLELAVAVVVCGLMSFSAVRAVLHARETARQRACEEHLRQIFLGLSSYEEAMTVLPPAAIWGEPPAQGPVWPRADDVAGFVFQNWVQLVLPHMGEAGLADAVDPQSPIGAPIQAAMRTAALRWIRCPSDEFCVVENEYTLQSGRYGVVKFARGNYALNGGTQRMAVFPGTTADPAPGGIHVEHDPVMGVTGYWGNGVASFNKAFSTDEFANGLATTVAVDEVRAGVSADDSRGVWALGQIGASVTWAHGMNGDAGRPNAPWKRADDVAGCPQLHEVFGDQELVALGMPCCSYCVFSEQATARSRHPGGVHVLTLDGAVHFLSDEIDPGLWHVLHSRETPAIVIGGDVAASDSASGLSSIGNRAPAIRGVHEPGKGRLVSNSLGMEFVRLPAGRFLMGQPDEELNGVFELDGTANAHWVEITRPTWLGTCEVTRGEYAAVMGEDSRDAEGGERDRWPMTDVTWHEADEFCRRLSELPTETACGRCYRLPTEAEWEYACRAGAREPYVYIRERQPGDETGENAMKEPPLPLKDVGSFSANSFGLYDMRGNAWEWCRDWSHPDSYRLSPEGDPTGPAAGYLKVVRGSDWLYVGQRCMLGFRTTEPWLRSPYIGFRVVCEVAGNRTE